MFPSKTRKELASQVAAGAKKGRKVAERILRHEKEWIRRQSIPAGFQGKTSKVMSMLEDEGTLLAARKYIGAAGKSTFSQFQILHVRLKRLIILYRCYGTGISQCGGCILETKA